MKKLMLGVIVVWSAFSTSESNSHDVFTQPFDPRVSPWTEGVVSPSVGESKEFLCNIILYSEDDQEMIDTKITIKDKAASHGGPYKLLTSVGGVNQIRFAIDGRWIKLQWYVSQKLVAAGIMVISDSVAVHRGVILYNPSNLEDQLSVGCEPVDKT